MRAGFAAEKAFVEEHAGSLMDLRGSADHPPADRGPAALGVRQADRRPAGRRRPAPPLDFGDIEHKYAGHLGGGGLEGNRFSNGSLGTTLMLIEVGGFSTGRVAGRALIDHVQADLRALGGWTATRPGCASGSPATWRSRSRRWRPWSRI